MNGKCLLSDGYDIFSRSKSNSEPLQLKRTFQRGRTARGEESPFNTVSIYISTQRVNILYESQNYKYKSILKIEDITNIKVFEKKNKHLFCNLLTKLYICKGKSQKQTTIC